MSFPPSEPSFLPPSSRRFAYRGPRSRRGLRILATSMLVFSIFFTGGCAWYAWDQAAHGIETDAVITGWGANNDRLTVRFTTQDGKLVRTSVDEPGKIENYPAGATIRVVYLSRDPGIARAAEESVAVMLLVIGGIFLLFSLGFSAYAWRGAPLEPRYQNL